MEGAVDRALDSEHVVRAIGNVDFVFGGTLQHEHYVDATENEHTSLDLDLAMCDSRQVPFTGRDPARLQRAAQGTEQSSTGRRDHVIDRSRMRIVDLAADAIVTRNRTVRTETHRLAFGRHLRETQWSFDTCQRNFGSVDDVAHNVLISSCRPRCCSRGGHDPPGGT